ncbi:MULTISPECIES: hypothetical protein [unclassified Sphingomonas]|uniref:hypothetical protein n=1 Tax=unclassified Sphingomonas TaxID=196159 RepID=UPI0006F4510E|nr:MULTISPECIES: hypothetical protein [unclassified Sphingomonas]KQM61811.1 hypothetical protein ASE65_06265 [Sphingomonas sp. Leaf16]KQN13085.1 hypothetical protein ASE81_07280 [Sphingomonas sp. Leaf29]KQN19971.1 hypothetical protein ASE83_07205 [Sphingomonas sp. Leaf32]
MPAPIDGRLRDAIAAARTRSLAAARDWSDDAAVRAVTARFADVTTLAEGEAAARALVEDAGWVGALLAPWIARLRDDPLSEPPFRSQRDTLRTGMVLAETPVASLTMAAIDPLAPAARTMPDTIVVGGRVSWTRYLRGGDARLWRWRADRIDDHWHGGIAASARPLAVQPLTDGAVVRLDGRSDAMLLVDPSAPIVSITITLRPGAAPFMREYDRVGGALVRVATLDDGAARSTMLLTLLRELGQADAEVFDALSRDPAFFVRWDAMHEWLASDARAALPRLRTMTDDPHPDVRAAAQAMLPLVEARMEPAWHA